MLKAIDSHTHLSSEGFNEDRSEVMKRAEEACEYIIDVGAGTSETAHFESRNLAEAYPFAFFTAGIHPHDAEKLGPNKKLRDEIELLLSHDKCVAVGECGYDFFYDHSPKKEQTEVFNWQIKLAKDSGLPLMIHTRDAEKETTEILSNYSGTAIFHCFTGTQSLADFGVKKGFFVSFSGIVTFKKAEDLRQVFLNLPLENILIETDSPYLAPVPLRGKRNESSFITHTAEFLAKLRSIPVDEFIAITKENSKRAFTKIEKYRSARK